MNELNDSMVSMSNNLHKCIKQSGMTVTEVAAAKGVTQATLHRLKSGKVKLGIQDAEHYARILGCTVQEILFETKPIPVIGTCLIKECCVERTLHDPQQLEVYAQVMFPTDRAAFVWKTEKNYKGQWYDWDGAVSYVRHRPIVDKYIDPDCFQKLSSVKVKEPIPYKLPNHEDQMQTIIAGVLYPQPHGLYTLHNGKTGELYENLDLEWATPTLSAVFRPELVGVHVKKISE